MEIFETAAAALSMRGMCVQCSVPTHKKKIDRNLALVLVPRRHGRAEHGKVGNSSKLFLPAVFFSCSLLLH